jgi:hypothetical protein
MISYLKGTKRNVCISNYPCEASYEGEMTGNNVRHGKGTYVWTNGDRYTGDWINGVISGKGIYFYANGCTYEGKFLNGKRHGKGTYVWSNGDRFKGHWIQGERSGKGIGIQNQISLFK